MAARRNVRRVLSFAVQRALRERGGAYAQIGLGIGKRNSGDEYFVKPPIRMGEALNNVIGRYSKKTKSFKPPVYLPPEVEGDLMLWCEEKNFQWMSFIRHRGLVMCRIKIAGKMRRIYAESFEALALALGFSEARIREMPGLSDSPRTQT